MDIQKVLRTFGEEPDPEHINEQTEEGDTTDPGYYDAEMDVAISELNQAGISLMDYPPSIRHRSFVLEGKLTTAANENRREDFVRLLGEWKNCFLTGWINGHGNQAKMNDPDARGGGMYQRTFSF